MVCRYPWKVVRCTKLAIVLQLQVSLKFEDKSLHFHDGRIHNSARGGLVPAGRNEATD